MREMKKQVAKEIQVALDNSDIPSLREIREEMSRGVKILDEILTPFDETLKKVNAIFGNNKLSPVPSSSGVQSVEVSQSNLVALPFNRSKLIDEIVKSVCVLKFEGSVFATDDVYEEVKQRFDISVKKEWKKTIHNSLTRFKQNGYLIPVFRGRFEWNDYEKASNSISVKRWTKFFNDPTEENFPINLSDKKTIQPKAPLVQQTLKLEPDPKKRIPGEVLEGAICDYFCDSGKNQASFEELYESVRDQLEKLDRGYILTELALGTKLSRMKDCVKSLGNKKWGYYVLEEV